METPSLTDCDFHLKIVDSIVVGGDTRDWLIDHDALQIYIDREAAVWLLFELQKQLIKEE